MNTQDILSGRRISIDMVLDYSEVYDYELDNLNLGFLDMVLDYSEYYDYVLGDSRTDDIYVIVIDVEGNYIITENSYIISTEDNYMIEYQ